MAKNDVFGVGNALVDILVQVDDDFIREHNLNKGGMTLADSSEQANLLQALENHEVYLRSGGSAANTMLGIARAGGKAFYVGKIAGDTNGEFYRQDLLEAGVHFDVQPGKSGPTGTSLVMTTPDAERTMYTNLGISTELTVNDVDTEKLKDSKYCYVEGYLWAGDGPRAASEKVFEEAKKNNVITSFTFSDMFLVSGFREDFYKITKEMADIVFMNMEEAKGFSEMENPDDVIAHIGNISKLAFITNGKHGAIVIQDKKSFEVPGFEVKAVDTTGAGDNFAAGVLFGLSRGFEPVRAARIGNLLASEVVQFTGGRLEKDYSSRVLEV